MTRREKKRRRHFLLVGHAGFWNRGCEAIIDTTLRLLTESFDRPTITVVSFDWENDRRQQGRWKGASFRNVIPERWRSPRWYLRVARRMLHMPQGDWRAMHRHLRGEYRRADAVLSVGGDNYSTDYSTFPGYYLDVLKYAREQGSKGVVWAATVGPFDDPQVRQKMVEVLGETPLITARESLSIDYLASLGITKNVRAVADPAFLLEPLASQSARAHRVGEDGKWLGVSASCMLWRYISEGTHRDRSDVLVRFIDWAIGELGFHVALVPHVVDRRPIAGLDRDDHLFLSQIAERLKRRDRAVLISDSLKTREMKYIISRCRFFVGSRMHSTISALSSGVPTLSLSYSMKSRGINQDLLGNQDFVLPVDSLRLERLRETFLQLMAREEEIRTILRNRIPLVREMARKNAKYLGELLGVDVPERKVHCRGD